MVEGAVADVPEMLGQSPAMAAVRTQAERLVRRQWATGSSPPVLICGENGTGKRLLATHLHRTGPHAGRPLLDVKFSCHYIFDPRATGEILGQMARGGTLLVVEPSMYRKADSDRFFRGVAAASAFVIMPISQYCPHGPAWVPSQNRVTICLPPLRARGHDVLVLAKHLLAQLCAALSVPARTLSSDAQAALLDYCWPGNVRELANVIERSLLLGAPEVITRKDLDLPRPARRR